MDLSRCPHCGSTRITRFDAIPPRVLRIANGQGPDVVRVLQSEEEPPRTCGNCGQVLD